MNDSTARAARFEGDAPAPAAYVWAPAGKPVAVSIPLPVITRLERAAVESFRSLSSRGSEIGGVLFGTVAPGTPHVVSIENFEPVECEYAAGPLYRLDAGELVRLDRLVEQRAAEGVRPVGFYRSHTRKGLSLDASDLALFDSRFRDAHHIALIIRPAASKACTAGIFIREDGAVQGDVSCQEFPFRAGQQDAKPAPDLYDGAVAGPRGVNAAPAAPRPAPRAQIVPIASRREAIAETPLPAPVAATPEPAPVPEPVKTAAPEPVKAAAPPAPEPPPPAAAPAPAKKPEPATATAPDAEPAPPPVVAKAMGVAPKSGSSKLLWITLGALVSVVLCVGFVLSSGMLHRGKVAVPASGQDSSALALRVDRNGADIVLTWNRDSDVIRKANHAVLQIADGQQHENVEMDLAQLRNGSIVYTPVTGDVVFKMEVSGAGQATTASESVRVLRTRPSPMPEEAAAQQAQPQPAAPKPVDDKASGPSAADEEQKEKPVALAQASRPFRADSLAQRLRPVTNTDVADAPAISTQMPSSGQGVNLGSLISTQAPPPVPASAPAAPASSAAQAPQHGGQIVQAQLLKKRDPEFPKLAREAGAGGVVELVATIAADGHVKSVRVVKGHPLLRQAASDAVKAWIYRPTMLNGKPVESETQILLNFKSER